MSRIEELIKEKCPNGVTFYKLCDIGEILSGLKSKSKEDFNTGNSKYITYANVFNNLAIDFSKYEIVDVKENENQNELKYCDVIFTASSEIAEETGMTSVVCTEPDEKYYLNSFCSIYRFNEEFIGHTTRY